MGMFNFDMKTILRERASSLKKDYDYPGNVDITTIGGITNTAKAEFFTQNNMPDGELKPEIMLIDERFRNYFMTAFPLHYFNDEIGLETLPLFKIALSSKIWDNARLMNTIFENLDKQALKSYRIHRIDTTGTHEGTKVDDETINRDIDTDHTGTRTNVGSNTGTKTDIGDNTGTKGIVSTETGTVNKEGTNTGTVETNDSTEEHDVLKKTGTDTLQKNETDTTNFNEHTTDGGTVTTALGGVDTETRDLSSSSDETRALTSTSSRTPSITTTENGGYTDTYGGVDTTKVDKTDDFNGTIVSADTPQGSLNNIRGSGVQKGDGIDAGVGGGATFNYMSAAQINDNTAVTDDTTTVTYGHTVGRIYNGHSTTETGTETSNGTDTGTININKTDGGNTTTSYGKTSTETRNLTGTKTGTDTVNIVGTDAHTLNLNDDTMKEVTSDSTRTDDLQSTENEERDLRNESTETLNLHDTNTQTLDLHDNSTETLNLKDKTDDDTNRLLNSHENGNTASNMNETDYMYSLELLAECEPFMNKIWDIFDDLFMQIIDVWP